MVARPRSRSVWLLLWSILKARHVVYFSGLNNFRVFYWIGEFIPLHEGHNAKAAGMAGGLVAFAATFAIVYVIDFCRKARQRLERLRLQRHLDEHAKRKPSCHATKAERAMAGFKSH